MSRSPDSGLGAIIDPQFVEDVYKVAFNGVGTDGKDNRDFRIRGAAGNQAQNFDLPVCQVGINLRGGFGGFVRRRAKFLVGEFQRDS